VSDRPDPEPATAAGNRIRAEAVVRGQVQGVGFRVFAARTAMGLGLGGWVANEPDGSVRCAVEGPEPAVETFLRGLAQGPLGSDVAAVEIARLPSAGPFERFEIRSGWHSGD
jgi:acylphosphatase